MWRAWRWRYGYDVCLCISDVLTHNIKTLRIRAILLQAVCWSVRMGSITYGVGETEGRYWMCVGEEEVFSRPRLHSHNHLRVALVLKEHSVK